jgi:uncharacterized membrane protein YcaP (DUF421 family)
MSPDEIFGPTGHVTWAQECARAVVVFCYGFALVRLAGRRVFGKWSALDIIVSIMVGSNLSRALTGGADLWGTLAATTLLMILHWVLAQAAARFPRMSRLLEGRPVPLGEAGRIAEHVLVRHAVSDADLGEALRGAGLDDAGDIHRVVLEPSGKISVLKGR